MKKIILILVLFITFNSNVYASVNSASSYTLMDAKTGRVLLSKDKDNSMLIASITKIMTSIIVLENTSIDNSDCWIFRGIDNNDWELQIH